MAPKVANIRMRFNVMLEQIRGSNHPSLKIMYGCGLEAETIHLSVEIFQRGCSERDIIEEMLRLGASTSLIAAFLEHLDSGLFEQIKVGLAHCDDQSGACIIELPDGHTPISYLKSAINEELTTSSFLVEVLTKEIGHRNFMIFDAAGQVINHGDLLSAMQHHDRLVVKYYDEVEIKVVCSPGNKIVKLSMKVGDEFNEVKKKLADIHGVVDCDLFVGARRVDDLDKITHSTNFLLCKFTAQSALHEPSIVMKDYEEVGAPKGSRTLNITLVNRLGKSKQTDFKTYDKVKDILDYYGGDTGYPGSQDLVFDGTVLEPHMKLRECGVVDGSVLHFVLKPGTIMDQVHLLVSFPLHGLMQVSKLDAWRPGANTLGDLRSSNNFQSEFKDSGYMFHTELDVALPFDTMLSSLAVGEDVKLVWKPHDESSFAPVVAEPPSVIEKDYEEVGMIPDEPGNTVMIRLGTGGGVTLNMPVSLSDTGDSFLESLPNQGVDVQGKALFMWNDRLDATDKTMGELGVCKNMYIKLEHRDSPTFKRWEREQRSMIAKAAKEEKKREQQDKDNKIKAAMDKLKAQKEQAQQQEQQKHEEQQPEQEEQQPEQDEQKEQWSPPVLDADVDKMQFIPTPVFPVDPLEEPADITSNLGPILSDSPEEVPELPQNPFIDSYNMASEEERANRLLSGLFKAIDYIGKMPVSQRSHASSSQSKPEELNQIFIPSSGAQEFTIHSESVDISDDSFETNLSKLRVQLAEHELEDEWHKSLLAVLSFVPGGPSAVTANMLVLRMLHDLKSKEKIDKGDQNIELLNGNSITVHVDRAKSVVKFSKEIIAAHADGRDVYLEKVSAGRWRITLRMRGGGTKRPLKIQVSDDEKLQVLIQQHTIATRDVQPGEMSTLVENLMKVQLLLKNIGHDDFFEHYFEKCHPSIIKEVKELLATKLEANRKLPMIFKALFPDAMQLSEGLKTLQACVSKLESEFRKKYASNFYKFAADHAVLNHEAFKDLIENVEQAKKEVEERKEKARMEQQMREEAKRMASEMASEMMRSQSATASASMVPFDKNDGDVDMK